MLWGGEPMSWRAFLTVVATVANWQRNTDAERRFQELYLKTASNITPEEEYLVQLYVDGGGSSLLVDKGVIGRLTAANAALWAGEMETWLQQNSNTTRAVQLDQSRRLLDRINLSIPISRWHPRRI